MKLNLSDELIQRDFTRRIERGSRNGYLTGVLQEVTALTRELPITTVSTKGQVILPKAVRQRRAWDAGTRLLVEDTAEGVLLRRAPAFAATRPEEVFGMLPFRGIPKSVEEMDAAVLREARRRAGD